MANYQRCRVIVTSCLILMCIVQARSQDKQAIYFLARPAQNCTAACESRGMSCIEVGAFPSDTLSIFHSMNITCSTLKATNTYRYADNPNYCIYGGWKGLCLGFKGLKSHHFTNCSVGNNPDIRRLCPCKEGITKTEASIRPTTITLTSTTTTTTTLSWSSSSSKTISYTAPTRVKHIGVETKLSTLEISVIVAVVALIFIVGLIFLVIFVRRRNKKRNNFASRIQSVPEQMRKNSLRGSENMVYMESMVHIDKPPIRHIDINLPIRYIDINNPPISSTTNNILYESSGNPCDECELNELYVSCDKEYEGNTLSTENPTYEKGVLDERDDNITGLTDEYASIDDI